MSKDTNRNATASWSGFSHQGQVGLLVAILELQKSGIDKENTFLQFESREDVAIYEITNNKPVYKSVHQVKAYYSKGTKINDYADVFKGKLIYERDGDGKLKKKDGKKISTGKFESGQWCQNENFLHTAQEITNWEDSIAKTEDNPPTYIKRYQYPNKRFYCDTTTIDGLIIIELTKMLEEDPGRASSTLNRLSYKLDLRIRNEHKTKATKSEYNIEFSLKEIEDILYSNDDYFVQAIFDCRKQFYDLFIELIDSSGIDERHEEELLKKVVLPIYHKDDEDFFRFLQNLNLNESERALQSTHIAFNKPGLEQVFYDLLFNVLIELPHSTEDNFLEYKSKKYILSSIIQESKKKGQVIKNIIENLHSQTLLWESTSIINKEINGAFHDILPEYFDIRGKEEKAEDFKGFMQYNGSTSFICRETAKIKLTNGDTN